MEYLSHSPEDTERIGEELGRTLHPGCVVAFRGGLGMGKTAFTVRHRLGRLSGPERRLRRGVVGAGGRCVAGGRHPRGHRAGRGRK